MPLKEKSIKTAVIGGDARQIFIANELVKMGYEVSVFALGGSYMSLISDKVRVEKSVEDAVCGAFLVILPIPFSRDGKSLNAPYSPSKIYLNSLFDSLCDCDVVALGLSDENTVKSLSEHCLVIDYASGEVFTLKNAFATAEGALAVIIEAIPTTLCGSVCAISGYGRIARVLASYLRSLGADVKIFARRESDRAHAKMCGMEAYKISDLAHRVSDADLVINTVPAVIINEEVLSLLPRDAKIIELASSPGGVNREAAERLKKDVINAQSLPARFSPKTAAKIVLESIFSLLSTEVQLC